MRRAISLEPVDYPPVILIATSVACQLTGTRQGQFASDPDVLADTLVGLAEMVDCDGVYVTLDNLVVHEAMGGRVTMVEDDERMGHDPVLSDLRDFRELAIPDPWQSPGMRTVLAAAQRAVEKAGDRYYVMANIDCGPFSTAANLRGVQSFLMDISTEDPGLVGDYLGFCTDLVVAYGRAMHETGVHGIQYGDSTAGLIGPDMFERFALPYLERSIRDLHRPGCDFWLHICGQTQHILPLLRSVPMQVFEVDAMVPMATARTLMEDSVALKGNLDTVFLQNAMPEEVYAATQKLIRAHGTRGLVVSAGCMVTRLTPLENLRAMTQACRDSSPDR